MRRIWKLLTGTARRLRWPATAFVVLFLLPTAIGLGGRTIGEARGMNWWEARNDTTHQAPDPAATPEAVLEVYAARAFGWRGAFGVHTWIASKAAGADHYIRYEVIGWRLYRGQSAVAVRPGVPDGHWFGSRPDKLMSRRGPAAEALIAEVQAAATRYPYPDQYRVWPGPNSNTFIAFVAREVPELGLDLPALAIGKDYLPDGRVIDTAPSGTRYQLSLGGLAGLTVAREEGLELNLLGLTFGLDATPPALKLPGIGRLGMPRSAAEGSEAK